MWADLLADPGSFDVLDSSADTVIAGTCTIGGSPAMLAAFDFSNRAGTLSIAAGDAFAAAIDAAVEAGLPVVGIATSGGARMQEGTLAFLQMLKIQSSLAAMRDAGGTLIVYMAHPTTGGVFASWATAGDVTCAEPGATLAFTGPRVAAALGTPIEPAVVQTAEGQLDAGHVDALIARDDLQAHLATVLAAIAPDEPEPLSGDTLSLSDRPAPPDGAPRGWDAVQAARGLDHGDTLAALRGMATDEVVLRGDRQGGVDDAMFAGLLRVGGRRLVVIGHATPVDGRLPGVAGLRTARRAAGLAVRLGVPLVSVIDAEGVELSASTATEGIAGEISASVRAWLDLSVPTVAVMAGSGSGGGALAWLAADRIVARPESWVAPISPEAAAAIVHRDVGRAAEMADIHRGSAAELFDDGVIDAVVAGDELAHVAVATAFELQSTDAQARRAARLDRYRHVTESALRPSR